MERVGLQGLAEEMLSEGSGKVRSDGKQGEITQERLKKACADFESIFINYLFKTMRRTIPESGMNSFPGKDMYTMLLDQKVAEDLAERGSGMGIQEMLFRQLGGSRRSDEKG